jgi:hypothetical protein
MYRLIANGVRRLRDGAEIPFAEGNGDYAGYQRWLEEGNTPEPMDPPNLPGIVVPMVQDRLDTFCRTRGYDGILSACTYASSTVPKFKAEGTYAVQARDSHWNACYLILAEVQAGAREVPTLEEVLAELPALVWPE